MGCIAPLYLRKKRPNYFVIFKIDNESSIDQMLQGVIPGVSVVNTTGKVGGTPKIRIRGTSTILGNQEPLWVVDGVIQTNPTPIPNDASPLSGAMAATLPRNGSM